MKARSKITIGISAVLLCFILACRYNKGLADFYASSIYPLVSTVLSFIASAVPFSLQEVVIVIAIGALILIPVTAKRRNIRLGGVLRREAQVLLLLYVWLYSAWGINYFRSSIYERVGQSPAQYDPEQFMSFLDSFTSGINHARSEFSCQNNDGVTLDMETLESEVKKFYTELPDKFGLCKPKKYQHPKKMIFGKVQAGCGVMGYIGPAFVESHVVPQTTPLQYPHTYAHEYSHVLGVSNEAEANYWGFKATQSSSDPMVRYGGYLSLLPHVASNARRLLDKEEYSAWIEALDQKILEDRSSIDKHWEDLRWDLLDKVQSYIYDIFLKINNIQNGLQNYSDVVLLLMTFDQKD